MVELDKQKGNPLTRQPFQQEELDKIQFYKDNVVATRPWQGGGGEQLNITADFLSNLYPTFKQLFEKTNRAKFNNLIQESFSEFVKEYAGDQVEKILRYRAERPQRLISLGGQRTRLAGSPRKPQAQAADQSTPCLEHHRQPDQERAPA